MNGDDDDERARLVALFVLSALAAVAGGIALGWILDAVCR